MRVAQAKRRVRENENVAFGRMIVQQPRPNRGKPSALSCKILATIAILCDSQLARASSACYSKADGRH